MRFRLLAMTLLTVFSASAPFFPGSSVFAGGAKRITADPALLSSDVALIMGGTGMPDPPQWFVNEVNSEYVQVHFPGYSSTALVTPEEAWPTFGELTGYQSVAQGVTDLNTAITQTDAGDNLLVFGVSQSALVASLEMRKLASNPPADLGNLHFALLAGPDNPMGGLFERFAGLDNPIMNYTLYPPTPTDLFPTSVYSGEYDLVSDFPEDPANILADLNAIAGFTEVHLKYASLTAEQVQSAVLLGHSGMTDFYMIPTPILPLLQPLYDSGESGKIMTDYLQPELKVIVDMGYGNLEHGVLPDPGGVDGAVGIGFLPRMDPLAVDAALQLGLVQGFVNGTNALLSSQGLPSLPGSVTTVLKLASGYDVTSFLDQQMNATLTSLSTLPGMSDLNPSVLFDGLPLIDGTPVIDAINQYLTDALGGL